MRRRRILLSAYACEPGKGSEPGVGWNLAKALAERHDVWVLTRANNRSAIEAELSERPVSGLHFLYFDLPKWARWWKRGGRGIQAYYYLWQLGAVNVSRAAHDEISFDLAHHATFVKYWAPAAAAFVGIPFVWGPVGGGESMPATFIRKLSRRSKIYERAREGARWLGEHDPLVRATARRARMAIATTRETSVRLRRLVQCPVVDVTAVALTSSELRQCRRERPPVPNPRALKLISVGRLLGWKGYHLSIRAFARADLPGARYLIFGDGPEKRNLEALARELGVQSQVDIVGEVPRSVVLEELAGADVFVHPSLHDSGGWATIEAMAASLPVICIGIGGPAVQVTREVGRVVAPTNVEETIERLGEAMRELATNRDLRTKLGEAARHRVASEFSWDRKVDQLTGIYEEVLKGTGTS